MSGPPKWPIEVTYFADNAPNKLAENRSALSAPEKRLAEALSVDVKNIRKKRDMLNGICPEAVELLRHKPVALEVFAVLRKMKPVRQVEAAEHMLAGAAFSTLFAKSLLAVTKPEFLTQPTRKSQINSIGLGIPGTVDPQRGVIVFAPNIFAVDVDIVEAVQRFYDLPVYISQDSQAAAWGEYLVGAGQGLSTVVSVTLGTGIRCGIVIDGKIYHGAPNNTAGELGHQIVEIDGNRCNCVRQGCLETYAGGLAIVRTAKESIAGLSDLIGKSSDCVSVEDVFELARCGNKDAKRVTDNVVKYVGIGLVNLVNLISPDLISMSGGICNAPAALLLNPLSEFVRRRAYPTISESVKICLSPLGSDAPLVGVAMLHRQTNAYEAKLP